MQKADKKKFGREALKQGWSIDNAPNRSYLVMLLYHLDPDDIIFTTPYKFEKAASAAPQNELLFPAELLKDLPAKYKLGSSKRFTLSKWGWELEFELKMVEYKRSKLQMKEDEIRGKLEEI